MVTADIILNYGPFYRIWPNIDKKKKLLYTTVGLGRPYAEPICKLYVSKDYGETWIEIVDFNSLESLNTTTGQPFITREGIILVPTWNASYYDSGKMWLAIYRSGNEGETWEKVYFNPIATYGKHFFQSHFDATLYIGVGIGGGGHLGRINYTPNKAMLLKSENLGNTWKPCLKVNSPTSLYSGVVTDKGNVIVTAREKKSVLISRDAGKTWNEKVLGKTARCINQIKDYLIVSSDSTVFLSKDDGKTWVPHIFPIKGLFLRYPTLYHDKILMSCSGWASLIVSLNKKCDWSIAFDATRRFRSKTFMRIVQLGNYLFLGDEKDTGTLVRVNISSLKNDNCLKKAFLSYFEAIKYAFMRKIMGKD